MHYGAIKNCDIANGIGVRVTLFVSGCTNYCEGCFNPDTWDFNYGELYTSETEAEILKLMEPDYIRGFTVLGGEPMEPENQREIVPLLKAIREKFPKKDIWLFTGFVLDEEIMVKGNHANCEVTEELLSLVDVLVDGRFVLCKKDLRLRYRGSSNQRIIDMRKTRVNGTITMWDETEAYS